MGSCKPFALFVIAAMSFFAGSFLPADESVTVRTIKLSINIPVETGRETLLRFTILDDKRKPTGRTALVGLENPILQLPKGIICGFIDCSDFVPTQKNDNSFFLGTKEPVAFTGETESLSINLQYHKPVKFVVKINVAEGGPFPGGINVYDVTGREQTMEIFDNMGFPSCRNIKPDDQGRIVFYGLPNHSFCVTAAYSDGFCYVPLRSPCYLADGQNNEMRTEWLLPRYQSIKVTLISDNDNHRNRALDIKFININRSMRNVKDGVTFLNPLDETLHLGEPKVARFAINDQAQEIGYTKILSGETLKITPQTKEHTIVLTKEKFEAELTFAAADAATGERLKADVYYALSQIKDKPQFKHGTVTLDPGNYNFAVTAPGYDFLPLTLNVKKNEKRTVECKLQKSRTVTVTVNHGVPTGPQGQLPGVFCLHSPASEALACLREQPLKSEFTIPFDPRLGYALQLFAVDAAPQIIPLNTQTPEKITVKLTKGVKVTGRFPAGFSAQVREEAKKHIQNRVVPEVEEEDKAAIDSQPLSLMFFKKDNPYLVAGGAKANPGEPWEASVMPGTYRVAMATNNAYLFLNETITVPEQDTMVFPEKVFSGKIMFEAVTGEARTCANDLFRRLSAK